MVTKICKDKVVEREAVLPWEEQTLAEEHSSLGRPRNSEVRRIHFQISLSFSLLSAGGTALGLDPTRGLRMRSSTEAGLPV